MSDRYPTIPQTIREREVARRLGVSRPLVRKWRAAGYIEGVVLRTPGCTRGGVALIYLDSLERFLESRGLRLKDRAA